MRATSKHLQTKPLRERQLFSPPMKNRGFVLQKSIKHLSLNQHFGRQSFKLQTGI